jgi:hypothetical protein
VACGSTTGRSGKKIFADSDRALGRRLSSP